MLAEAPARVYWLSRLWSRKERRLQLLVFVVGVCIVDGLSVPWFLRADFSGIKYWKTSGYPGVFFISFSGSGSILLPRLVLIAACRARGLELNLIAVGMLSGTDETVGEMSVYAIGYGASLSLRDVAFATR